MKTAAILGSFHYFRRRDLAELAEAAGSVTVDFFADSGAFSAANAGAKIDRREYASWLAGNAPSINFAAGLDVIGDPAASRRNTEALEDAVGDRVVIVPTFHVGSPWSELERLCAAHRFVALGGAVRFTRRGDGMMRWLVQAHQIGREHGTVFHGFGLTRPPYPHALPWYSVDSVYWTSAQRTGTLSLFGGHQFATFRIGTDGPHEHAEVIRTYGATASALAQPGFARVAARGNAGRSEREWMNRATLEAWLRYSDWLTRVRAAVPPPPRVTGAGPKVYLAAASLDDYRSIVAAVAAHRAPERERIAS